MGYSVGWDSTHRRWKGYGVPAYCDADGCTAEIDRGMGYGCECDECSEDGFPDVFLCGEHGHEDVTDPSARPEHPDWIAHLLTDRSWAVWREENPEKVAALTRVASPEIPKTGDSGGSLEETSVAEGEAGSNPAGNPPESPQTRPTPPAGGDTP